MAGIDQHQSFPDAAFAQTILDLVRDVDECPTGRDLKPEFLAIAFHSFLLQQCRQAVRACAKTCFPWPARIFSAVSESRRAHRTGSLSRALPIITALGHVIKHDSEQPRQPAARQSAGPDTNPKPISADGPSKRWTHMAASLSGR